MTILRKLFPKSIDNNYRGSRIALYGAGLFAILFTFRSLVHYFAKDGGANSIATIITFPGNPDPDTVIYLVFSLWGAQQLVTVTILWLVLLRYRAMLPFMLLLIFAEVLLRMGAGLMHPLTADYFERTPPGAVGNLPMLVVAGVLLLLSLRETAAVPDDG